jgi:hypothetical protein
MSYTTLLEAVPLIAITATVISCALYTCYKFYNKKSVKTNSSNLQSQQDVIPPNAPNDPSPAPAITPSFLASRNITKGEIEERMTKQSENKMRRISHRRRWSGGQWEHFGSEI